MPRRLPHTLLIAVTATLAVAATAAWRPTPAAGPGGGEADCTFALRGSNSLSFDVWVYLYDSGVKNDDTIKTIFSHPWKQLSIQNQRIPRGGAMDRRYTASGACDAHRTWLIKVKRGSQAFFVEVKTSGTASTSRTVDIGASSKWVDSKSWPVF